MYRDVLCPVQPSEKLKTLNFYSTSFEAPSNLLPNSTIRPELLPNPTFFFSYSFDIQHITNIFGKQTKIRNRFNKKQMNWLISRVHLSNNQRGTQVNRTPRPFEGKVQSVSRVLARGKQKAPEIPKFKVTFIYPLVFAIPHQRLQTNKPLRSVHFFSGRSFFHPAIRHPNIVKNNVLVERRKKQKLEKSDCTGCFF